MSSAPKPLYLQARDVIGEFFQRYGIDVKRFETVNVQAYNKKASVQLIDTNLVAGRFIVKSETTWVISPKWAGLQCVEELPSEPVVCLNMGVYEQYVRDISRKALNPKLNHVGHNRHLLYWQHRQPNRIRVITAGGMQDLVDTKGYTGSTKFGETVVFIPSSKLQDFNPGTWKFDYW